MTEINERRRQRKKVYNSKRWIDLRTTKIQDQPLCEDCLKEGKITLAQEVHHIKSPFRKGLTDIEKDRLAYTYENLASLCKECHIKRHNPLWRPKDIINKYLD